MAITIEQSPGSVQPAYNDLVYVVSSTNTAEENFQFVADVYISGVTSPTYYRFKKPPHPTHSVGVFDIHRIMENYVSHDINTTTYGFQENTNSWKQYQVKFGEEYGESSAIVVTADMTSSGSGEVFNGALGFIDYKDFPQSSYLISSGFKLFLTNAPNTQNIYTDENAWLHMMTNTSGSIYFARVRTYDDYDAGGSIIATHQIINPYTDSEADENGQYIRFGCGTKNLNLIEAAKFFSGAQSIITAATKSYTVFIQNSVGSTVSETVTFNIRDKCSRYDSYRLHFLNKLGGFDSLTFDMVAVETTDISRTLFKKTVGTTTATTFSYAKSDKENQELSVMYQDTLTMESNWITEAEGTWLEELVHSPVVFLDHATHGLIALNITKARHTKRKDDVDKLINIQIEAKYSFNNSRQRG